MYTVYVLQNTGTKRFYVGCTENLARRLQEHNRSQTNSTTTKYNWTVVYKEEFGTLKEARSREREIKSYKGGNAFKKLLAGVVYR